MDIISSRRGKHPFATPRRLGVTGDHTQSPGYESREVGIHAALIQAEILDFVRDGVEEMALAIQSLRLF